MLAATPLISSQSVKVGFPINSIGLMLRESTHKLPMKKIADTPTFRVVDICNFHMQINGNSSIKESDTRLKTPVARM